MKRNVEFKYTVVKWISTSSLLIKLLMPCKRERTRLIKATADLSWFTMKSPSNPERHYITPCYVDGEILSCLLERTSLQQLCFHEGLQSRARVMINDCIHFPRTITIHLWDVFALHSVYEKQMGTFWYHCFYWVLISKLRNLSDLSNEIENNTNTF